VLVLTEVAAGESGELLVRPLREFGYTVVLPDAGQDKYRVLLACRTGDLDVVADTGVDFMPHHCVAARVTFPHTEIGVVGLYVSSRGPQHQRNIAKRAFQDAVTAALPGMSERLKVTGPVVITGDLNVVEPRPRPPLRGVRALGVRLLPLVRRSRVRRCLPPAPTAGHGPLVVRSHPQQRLPHRPHLHHRRPRPSRAGVLITQDTDSHTL
jgi:hypothetical protein